MRYAIALVWIALLTVACGDDGPATPPTPVVPNFQGQWTGSYDITGCSGTGVFATPPAFCDTFSIGSTFPLTLTLTQTGTQVTGTAQFGNFTMPVSGPIAADGRLLLTGTGVLVQGSITINVSLAKWATVVSGTSMAGNWEQVWTTNIGVGVANTAHGIRVLTKTG